MLRRPPRSPPFPFPPLFRSGSQRHQRILRERRRATLIAIGNPSASPQGSENAEMSRGRQFASSVRITSYLPPPTLRAPVHSACLPPLQSHSFLNPPPTPTTL